MEAEFTEAVSFPHHLEGIGPGFGLGRAFGAAWQFAGRLIDFGLAQQVQAAQALIRQAL
jgi:hypothetical protein